MSKILPDQWQDVILESFAESPDKHPYALEYKGQLVQTFNRIWRHKTQKDAWKNLIWHCRYVTWLKTGQCAKEQDIKKFINKLKKQKLIKIVKVKTIYAE